MNDCEHETWSLTYKKTSILNNLEATKKPLVLEVMQMFFWQVPLI